MRIFARIFLSFWLATVLAISVSISSVMFRESDMASEISRSVPTGQLERCVQEISRRYEQGSRSNLDQPVDGCRADFVVDIHNHDVLAREVPGNLKNPIAEARKTGNMEIAPLPGVTVAVVPAGSSPSQTIAAVFSFPAGRPPFRVRALVWQIVPFAAAAALICYFLTRYILTPLQRLGNVADDLGGGDLATRTETELSNRRDEFGELARTFNRMADRIESLVKSQKMFLAHVSHELGSPLTRLNMTLALARRKADASLNPELDRMEQESIELNHLVQQLLLLARLESGNEFNEAPACFFISDVVQEVVDNAAFEAQQINRNVTIVRANDFSIQGHRDLLKRALDNVIRNALRFTPERSAVEIEFYPAPAQRMGCVNVLDSGPGVNADKLHTIFEPFSSSGSSGGHSGAGLGLTIARHAVLAHRGQISAQNLPTCGLMISIILPATLG